MTLSLGILSVFPMFFYKQGEGYLTVAHARLWRSSGFNCFAPVVLLGRQITIIFVVPLPVKPVEVPILACERVTEQGLPILIIQYNI